MADLSDGANWFEIDASNNKTSPNGWPEGMMPSGVNDSARADKGALKRFWDRVNPVQVITPSGGLWTFTTSNAAYPTAYVNGEVYTFKANADSAAGDQFRVNSLAAKPIWRRTVSGGFGSIIAQDIVFDGAPQLIYDSGANGGSGAFLLLNPHLPISGDGAGGITATTISTSGRITANEALISTGPGAEFVFADRGGTSPDWYWYATGGLARLGSGAGDRISIDASGDFNIVGNYEILGAIVLAISGSVTQINDASARAAILLGGTADQTNYYRNANHSFQSVGGTTQFGSWSAAGGLNIAGTCTAVSFVGNFAGSGTSTINTGTVTTTTVNASATVSGANVTASSNITAAGSVTGGSMHCTGTMQVDGQSNLLGALNVGPSGGYARIDGAGTYNVSGSWLTFSDRRVKEDIAPYEHGLEAILALAPVQFRYRAGTPFADARHTVRLGLVAQDVEPVLPEIVGMTEFAGDTLATLAPGNLVYALINTAKELAAQNAALAARVAALEAR
jgi:hypothetical protein